MLDGVHIIDLTPSVLLGLTVLLLLTGRLIPRATLNDKAEEAERWRAAYEAERLARSESDAQTKELLEVAHLTHAIINAMFVESKHARPAAGGANAPPET